MEGLVELTPEQTQLIANILIFFPLLFQYVQRIIASKWLAPLVGRLSDWINAHLDIPLSADMRKRVFVWSLALLVMVVTDLPILPELPAYTGFGAAFINALLLWGTNSLLSLAAFFTALHVVYQMIWKEIFSGQLSSESIEATARVNMASNPPLG